MGALRNSANQLGGTLREIRYEPTGFAVKAIPSSTEIALEEVKSLI
jgi:hypothetical protein